MEEQLNAQLGEIVDDLGLLVTQEVRHEYLEQASNASQGADGLVEHVTEVEWDGERYTFEVDHPTAPLHERGGHIEPIYTKAKLVGYSRDDFYQSLKDCNEWVTKKSLFRDSVNEVRNGSRGRRVTDELR